MADDITEITEEDRKMAAKVLSEEGLRIGRWYIKTNQTASGMALDALSIVETSGEIPNHSYGLRLKCTGHMKPLSPEEAEEMVERMNEKGE